MFILILVVLFFVVLAFAAYRWGIDSRDSIDSKEWERRNASQPPVLRHVAHHD